MPVAEPGGRFKVVSSRWWFTLRRGKRVSIMWMAVIARQPGTGIARYYTIDVQPFPGFGEAKASYLRSNNRGRCEGRAGCGIAE